MTTPACTNKGGRRQEVVCVTDMDEVNEVNFVTVVKTSLVRSVLLRGME